MAAAALRRADAGGLPVAGGVIVTADDAAASSAHPGLTRLTGDHPRPAERSARAAAAIGELAARVDAGDRVLALISGGTSSLIGAPAEGIDDGDYRALCDAVLFSGLDIGAVNALRKRFSRWGAGRLALAVAPARVSAIAISDVPDDDPAVIGSGPLSADSLSARALMPALDALTLDGSARARLRGWLGETVSGSRPETPKRGDPRLAHVEKVAVIGAGALARAAVEAARRAGITRVVAREARLTGEASAAGPAFASELLGLARAAPERQSVALVAIGETTVTLPPDAPTGGRCQELALAAAGVLAGADGSARRCTLVAAGSDGRDGPTDAAGAMVSAGTWRRVRDAGLDPDRLLATHASHRALAAAEALIPRFASGTNLGDLAVGIVASTGGN